MGTRTYKVEKQALSEQMPEQKTKTINYRIDVILEGYGKKTIYMQVTGVPEDLPEEYENTVIRAAEAQFAAALNQRTFLEFYNEGKSSKDEQPVFYNLSKIESIKIMNISKIN